MKPTKVREAEERGICLPFDGNLSGEELRMLDRGSVTGDFVPIFSTRSEAAK